MGEREFLIFLDPETRLCRYRHYHVSNGKEIVEFRIQLEILIDDTLGILSFDMTLLMEKPIKILLNRMVKKQKIGSKDIQ